MFISITRWLFLLGILMQALGCAKDSVDPQMQALLDKPRWVVGESNKYQEHFYFMGHGVSANLDIARTQSMEDLTDSYKVQLQSYFQDAVSGSVDSGAEPASSLADQMRLYRERIEQNREIAEVWQDPTSNAYHVLSVIDRVNVANVLVDEIYRFDRQIERVIYKSDQETDPLQRIAIAKIAFDKFNERQQLLTTVKILNPTTAPIPTRWTDEQLQSQISQWLSDVKIMPVLNQNNPKLFDALVGGVSKAGFVVDYGANPDYILKASFEQGQIKWNDGVYTLEGNLHLELWDGQTKGQVRGKTQWPIHVSATERSRLPLETAEAIEKANKDKLQTTILEFEND